MGTQTLRQKLACRNYIKEGSYYPQLQGEEEEAGLARGEGELWCSLRGELSQGHRFSKLGWASKLF